MAHPRVRRLALLALLLPLVTACEQWSVGPRIAAQLGRGRDLAAELVARGQHEPAARLDSTTTIALGYLERQRLGLGGPFRLIDIALHDPRLDPPAQRAVAWALLARTLDGAGDAVSPLALDSLGSATMPGRQLGGAAHLRLIERVVRDAPDPRAGEMAVRLAYALVAAEGRVAPSAPLMAARAAALIRDRDLARQDARDLLRVAWHREVDPLTLLVAWRHGRRFRVEAPLAAPLSADDELAAMESAPRAARALRGMIDEAGREPAPADAPATSLLGAAAPRLAALAEHGAAPPETPVVVTVGSYRSRLLGHSLGTGAARRARWRFLQRGRSEEALVAEHALASRVAPSVAVERAMLAAAVALRAFGQETPWRTVTPEAAVRLQRLLTERFGIAPIHFDPGVPASWRPYYVAMLSAALDDLARVLPSLRLDGLTVHVGENPMRDLALALHDPVRRVIHLPLATSAGTITHEIAHDIDWQAALARYAVRGDYATDRAMRDSTGSRLAASMRGLTAASIGSERDGGPQPSSRPTEVFARSVDWFVAVALASEGRMNGYLSSVQDDLLTGYVAVSPPDVTGEAGSALVSVLDDVAPPARAARAAFLARYGPARVLTAYDLVRRMLEMPIGAPPDSAGAMRSLPGLVSPLRALRDSVLALADGARCRGGTDGTEARVRAARRAIVEMAARARAEGIMRAHGSVLAAGDAWRWAGLGRGAPAPSLARLPALDERRAEALAAVWAPEAGVLGQTACGDEAFPSRR